MYINSLFAPCAKNKMEKMKIAIMSKKATSFLLALLMVCSLTVPALAEEPAQDDYSTTVSYTGKSTEHYTLTVPQSLEPGNEGHVKPEDT